MRSQPYLPHVQRLVPRELLQDEELVPHPAPPPPGVLGGATRRSPSPSAWLRLAEQDGVQRHGAGTGPLPQEEHAEGAQEPQKVHVSATAAGVCSPDKSRTSSSIRSSKPRPPSNRCSLVLNGFIWTRSMNHAEGFDL